MIRFVFDVTVLSIVFASLAPASILPETFLGTYTVNEYYNAAGCAPYNLYMGNPFYCLGPAPGPIHLTGQPAGQYRLETIDVSPSGGGNMKMWIGTASGGTRIDLAPSKVGMTFDFTVSAGQEIVLYDWDWYAWDNPPDRWTEYRLYRLDRAQTWTQIFPIGGLPLPTADASAVLDPASKRMIVFGGSTSGCTFDPSINDTWVLTKANGIGSPSLWATLAPMGEPPPGRRGHSAIYNPATKRMVVYSGDPVGCAVSRHTDLWVLKNADAVSGVPAWEQLSPSGPIPPGRSEFAVGYDVATNRMIIYGGFGPSGNLHDVWVLENADGSTGTPNWLALSPLGGPPAASNQAAAAYDPNTNTLMIAGGGNCCTSPTGTFDVWVLRNANGLGGQPQFVKLNPVGTPPTPRYGLVSAYDIASNKLVIFGGGSEEVWVLNNANGIGGTPEFVLLETDGGPPPPRGGVVANPTAVYDEAVKRMTIFGGFAASIGPVNDTWVLDLASSAGPPGAPRSPTPANGASGVALAPTLRWIAGSGATSHDVYFGTTSPPPLVTNTTGTSYVPGKLATGTTYYWKVEAKNANGATPSPVWSFRTKLTPDSPTNPSPANGATGVSRTPTLTWGAAAGATSYDVYFGLASTPAFKVSVTAASFTPASTLLANRLYYWRVVSRSATGTKTGPTWNFRTRP